jgi:hypothetical protein
MLDAGYWIHPPIPISDFGFAAHPPKEKPQITQMDADDIHHSSSVEILDWGIEGPTVTDF